ncbi:hypothetical protein KC19_2G161900 [Ceratodon purpureus]|uniref:Uncharacterized protein n=1 Tax=Ceratodon purpureus TaxID=3225 RepID=A0A8T0IXH3_CERPU|nr:hypothetical protein KC19_2G161900 [Ceratodon purpureus]
MPLRRYRGGLTTASQDRIDARQRRIDSEMVDNRLSQRSAYRPVEQIIREASPRSARLIEQRLQQEIEELLNRAETERHEENHATSSNDNAEPSIRVEPDTPYTRDDLPQIMARARNTPNFEGLTALEVYAQTAQHLSDANFAAWMADGRSYFNLGRRHPR